MTTLTKNPAGNGVRHINADAASMGHSQKLRWSVIAMCLCSVVAGLAISARSQSSANSTDDPRLQEYEKPGVRFDSLVRDDFFAGMAGNRARLESGLRFCERVLAKHPQHAEALVWHGGGLISEARFSYVEGNAKLGDEQFQRGIKEMDEARRIEPDNIGVLIGRAALLIGLAQSGFDSGDAQGRMLLKSAVEDYETVLEMEKPFFANLSVHSRGELLFGLASGWSMLANDDKARLYLERITHDCADSKYEVEARGLLAQQPLPRVNHQCIGCHVD